MCLERKGMKLSSNPCYLDVDLGMKSNLFYFNNIYMCITIINNNKNNKFYIIEELKFK